MNIALLIIDVHKAFIGHRKEERDFRVAMLQHGISASHEIGLMDIYYNRALVSYEVVAYMLGRA